jgi:S-adenosylmethionine synthetase
MRDMAQVVITGATGMLGRALMRELNHFHPMGTGLSRAQNEQISLDLLNTEAVEAFFASCRPRVIIHAAAERRPDFSERHPDRVRALNVEATRTLARIARRMSAWMLYLSTDYVFDGRNPPYKPGDSTNPLNVYGATKLEGEQALRSELPDSGILRVGVLFGRVEFPGESAVMALVEQVRAAKETSIDDWARRYPTFVDDVARICQYLTARWLAGEATNEIWHWCGDELLTKYGQALLLAKLLHLPATHLRPDREEPKGAPRPRDCRLDCSTLESLGLRRTPIANALELSLRESRI